MAFRVHKQVSSGIGLMIVLATVLGITSMVYAQSANPTPPSAEQMAKAKLTHHIIQAEGGGYGYDILADGKLFIHQPNIPGQPGTTGFKKKSDSEKVAALVIKKLRNKELPPTVTAEELRQLKVID
jgi:hypothetical protein